MPIQFARRHDFNGFSEQELEFRRSLKYPPFSRIALLTLKGRNEDKVKFAIGHLKRELEKKLTGFKDLILKNPGSAPLHRAETFYRHQITLHTTQMSAVSRQLAQIIQSFTLPDDVLLSVDIDPVDLM